MDNIACTWRRPGKALRRTASTPESFGNVYRAHIPEDRCLRAQRNGLWAYTQFARLFNFTRRHHLGVD